MQKAISKYGLAAHLALLAVAPLFLYPLCGDRWMARVILWFSVAVSLWMLIEPSRRKGEMLHDARFRVFKSLIGDSLFWFSILLVVIAAIRVFNGGVSMAYDAEVGRWSLRPPSVPYLPGALDDVGFLPFSVVVGITVIMQASRHALGKSARVGFLFMSSFLAGLSAILLTALCRTGNSYAIAAASCSTSDATFIGGSYGLFLAGGIIALTGAFERKWKRAMPLLIVAIGGCGAGLYVFAPDFVIIVYAVAVAVVLILSILYAQRKIGGLVIPKSLAFLLISAAAGGLLVVGLAPESVVETRFAWLFEDDGHLFTDGFLATRATLSAIAEQVWKSHPWIGTGLGSFGIDIRFWAKPEMWQVVPAAQTSALNGWWQLLAERGISGMIFFLSPLVFLLWTYVIRGLASIKAAISSRRAADALVFHPMCWLGPVAVAVTAVCGFFDHSFWRAETMMAVATMFAMSGSSFPAVANKTGEEPDTEKETNG